MNEATQKSSDDRVAALQHEALRHRKLTGHRFFLGYAYALLREAPLYRQWQSLLAYIRKFRTIAFVLRIVSILFTVIETGALVILSTLLFLVLLPIGTALMLGILLTALLESRKTNRTLGARIAKKPCSVLFLSRSDNPFLEKNALDLASRGHTVLIISPYWITPRGLHRGKFYCTARREANGIYLVRRYYFFSLRKHVLSRTDCAYWY